MSKTIKIYEKDAEKIDALVDDEHDEMSWAAKVSKVVDKAHAWEQRGSDVL